MTGIIMPIIGVLAASSLLGWLWYRHTEQKEARNKSLYNS